MNVSMNEVTVFGPFLPQFLYLFGLLAIAAAPS